MGGRVSPTREAVLYACLALLALLVRLAGLGRWALTGRELDSVSSALAFVRRTPLTGAVYSPLGWNAQALLFAMTRPSELAARLLPVLVGAGMIPMIASYREVLGRKAALVAALILAVSPGWVYFGRLADGAVLAACCSMGLFLAVSRFWRGASPTAVWVWLGLGLASGSGFCTLLLALGTVILAAWASPLRRTTLRLAARRLFSGQGVLVGVLALLGGATALLAHPAGLGAVAELAGDWVRSLWVANGTPWWMLWRNLAWYEPLAVLLGGLMFIHAIRSRRDLDLLLGAWLLVALIVGLLPGHRDAYWFLEAMLPLTLLAARGLADLLDRLEWRMAASDWVELALLLLVLAFGYLNLAYYAYSSQPALLWLAFGGLLVFVALWLGILFWDGLMAALRLVTITVLALGCIVGLRHTTALSVQTGRDPRETLVYDAVVLPTLEFSRYLHETSLDLYGDQRNMQVAYELGLEREAIWYLRDMDEVIPLGDFAGEPQALFARVSEADGAPATMVGRRFHERAALDLTDPLPADRLRWALFRDQVGWETFDYLAIWARVPEQ